MSNERFVYTVSGLTCEYVWLCAVEYDINFQMRVFCYCLYGSLNDYNPI